MIEMITDPLFGAIDSVVCFTSDTVAGLTGVRCTRDTSGVIPFGKQVAQRQQIIAASQRQPVGVKRQPTAPQRSEFATNFRARG